MIHSLWFQAIVPPLVFLVIGVFANKLGRRDGDDSPRRNDWAVSTTVLLMTFGKVTGDLLVRVGHPELQGRGVGSSVVWMLGIIAAVFISIEHDRYRSWVKDDDGKPTDQKRVLVGVLVPDTVGIIIFAAYQMWSVG
jgi:hypothetical protein